MTLTFHAFAQHLPFAIAIVAGLWTLGLWTEIALLILRDRRERRGRR